MSRLTKKFNGEYYHKEAKTLMFNNETDYNAIQKLGKLEDIMENHNVNDYRMLGFLLKEYERLSKQEVELYADLGMFQNENINLTKDIEKYWNLEKELGCPLEVVFKAMTMGILVKNHEDLIEIGYSDRRDKYVYFSTEEIYLKNWQSHGIEKTTNRFQITYGDDGEWCVYLKDYQKTWWLKGEKDGRT